MIILNWETVKGWPQELQASFIWNLIIFQWESIKETPQDLRAGIIWTVILFQLRINSIIASRAAGHIHVKLAYFYSRINWRMASTAAGWIHVKFDYLLIKNQLKNGLKNSRLDAPNIWSFFNDESMKELPQELQAGFVWNLIIFQLRINWRTASRAPDWSCMKFDNCWSQNQLQNDLQSITNHDFWHWCNEITVLFNDLSENRYIQLCYMKK